MKYSTLVSKILTPAARIFLLAVLYFISPGASAQNVFSGEPVQWIGQPNSYSTEPYNSDYRTTAYRKVSTTDANPTDGRGQWSTTINAIDPGGNINPTNMPGGAGQGFLFVSGPSGNRLQNKWNFAGVGQGAWNSVNDVTYESGGEDMGLDMDSTGYYTFNFKDAGYVNSQFYVGFTVSAPITVTRNFDSLNASTNSRIVSIGTSAAPDPVSEHIYVRYVTTNNDFTTGTAVVEAFGADNQWYAEIPAQDCGTTVYYYVYTSTRQLSQINADSESDRSLCTLRYDDNQGANYSYDASTANIIASAAIGGTINPSGSINIACGTDTVFSITPNDCQEIQDVLVDGVSVGAVNQYTFTGVTGNHSINAVFHQIAFSITYTSNGGGQVDPGFDPLDNLCGHDVVMTFFPAPCSSIGDVIIDGVSVGAVTTYTFVNNHANHTVHVEFVTTPYTITVTNTLGGSILPGAGTVNCGSSPVYTITPDPGFTILDVLVDGVSVGAAPTYTFTNVQADHTITATYSGNSFTINGSAGANGTVTPAGNTNVGFGANATYTITSDVCYHVDDVLVDGISVGAVTSYTFTNVTANHTISATFALNSSLDAPVISGPVNTCPYIATGEQVTYTAFSAGAAGYTWTIPPTNVTIVSGQGTATLVVTFQNGFAAQANKQIRVRALSPCGNSPLTIKYLAAQSPSTPAAISGNTNVCAIIGTADTYTYTIPAVPGAASYIWGAQQSGSITITHPNGPGVNDTTITVSFTTGFTTSNITVAAVNGCGTSGIRTITISRVVPSTPSPISGPIDVCENSAPGGTPATYTTSNAAGITYNWTIPAGATGFTGQGTSTISFTYPNGFTTGTVSVLAANGCGVSGSRTLNVARQLPAATSAITVVQTQGCPDRILTYSVTGMPSHATSVVWTVPTAGGAVLISGQGTTSISVSYPPTALNGTVTAQSVNNCGNSTIRTLAVHLTSCGDGPPPPPGPRTAKGNTTTVTAPAEAMQVSVFPNPATSEFKLQVITAGKDAIHVRVMDMQGRTMKNFTVMPYQTTSIGSDLGSGAYMMEVRQGSEVKVTKLLKF